MRLMQSEYTIRRATVHDVATITYQRRRMFEDMQHTEYTQAVGVDEAYSAWLHARLVQEQYIGWLATADEVVVAGAGIELSEQMPHPATLTTTRAHIVNVYVEPAHRRRGLARKLVHTVLMWCQHQNVRVITLQASDEGRPLYESLGFKPTREMILVRAEDDYRSSGS